MTSEFICLSMLLLIQSAYLQPQLKPWTDSTFLLNDSMLNFFVTFKV